MRQAAEIRQLVTKIGDSALANTQPEAYAAWREFALAEANRLDQRNNSDLFDLTVSETEPYRFKDASQQNQKGCSIRAIQQISA